MVFQLQNGVNFISTAHEFAFDFEVVLYSILQVVHTAQVFKKFLHIYFDIKKVLCTVKLDFKREILVIAYLSLEVKCSLILTVI